MVRVRSLFSRKRGAAPLVRVTRAIAYMNQSGSKLWSCGLSCGHSKQLSRRDSILHPNDAPPKQVQCRSCR